MIFMSLYMGCFYYFYIIIFNMQLRRLPSFRKKPVNGRYFQNIRIYSIELCIKTAKFAFQKNNCNFVLTCYELFRILLKCFKINFIRQKISGVI